MSNKSFFMFFQFFCLQPFLCFFDVQHNSLWVNLTAKITHLCKGIGMCYIVLDLVVGLEIHPFSFGKTNWTFFVFVKLFVFIWICLGINRFATHLRYFFLLFYFWGQVFYCICLGINNFATHLHFFFYSSTFGTSSLLHLCLGINNFATHLHLFSTLLLLGWVLYSYLLASFPIYVDSFKPIFVMI